MSGQRTWLVLLRFRFQVPLWPLAGGFGWGGAMEGSTRSSTLLAHLSGQLRRLVLLTSTSQKITSGHFILHFINFTWVLLKDSHFSIPRTLLTLSRTFFVHISRCPSFNSKKCKHSSWVHAASRWFEHSARQWGHATDNSYCNPLRHGNSWDNFCKVSSMKTRTRLGISTDSDTETGSSSSFLCFSAILIKLFLQRRIKS